MNSFKSNRKKRIEQSKYGRNEGWIVELNSKRIAKLTEAEFYDMFWFSYKVIEFDDAYKDDLKKQEFWENTELKFFSIAMNEYCKNFPLINLTDDFGSYLMIAVRGLEIDR